MTRYTFGGYGGDQVTQSPSANAGVFKAAGSLASTGTFWSAQTGGTQYTDLIDPNNAGAAITGVSTDANGRPLAFQGPNGIFEGWLDFGGGRFKIQATDAGLLTTANGDARYESGAANIIYVSPSGNDARNGKTWGTAKATIAAALTAMGTSPGRIVLDIGTHPVTGSLAWSATSTCGMIGLDPHASIIQVSAQTGPGLDLTAVGYGLNGAEFGNFTIKGDGTAGSAKKGLALSSSTSVVGANFHDINVLATGGACFDLGMTELSRLKGLAADQPINAATNDIPYLLGVGAFNGNDVDITLSATVTGSASVGPSGAIVAKDNGSTTPHDNKFAVKIEGLRCGTNATILALAGNSSVVADLQVFDAGKVSGATGTSYVRYTAPAVTDLGGNIMRGVIPGKGTNATDMDCGVDMRQSRNSVHGVKGYKGTNVILASGVVSCDIDLKGAVSTATDAAVVDNSGNGTNTVRDTYMSVLGGNGTGNRLIKSGGYYGPANHVPGTIATTAGNMMAIPVWIPAAMTAVSIECQVTVAGTAGTVVRMGIFSPGTADNPATLVLDAGTQPADTTGVKAITISQPLSAGLYWFTACPQGGNPTFISVGSGSLSPVAPASFGGGNNCYYVASVTGAFPSTFGSVSPFTGGIKVMVKAA